MVFLCSEKQRCPAWCDRILWRKERQGMVRNVVYDSIMDQFESDHKPVYAVFDVKVELERLCTHGLLLHHIRDRRGNWTRML